MALPPHLANLESRLTGRVDEALGDYRRAVEERLRAAVEQLSTASQELPPPSLPALLDGLELQSLDLASRKETTREALGSILDAQRDFDRARTQTEVLDTLLERALSWADRAAVVLIRDEELIGWGQRGFGARGFSGRPLTQRADVRERLVPARGCRELDAADAAELAAELDIDAAGATVIVPLVLRDQIAAILWCDRSDEPPATPAIQLLVSFAAQRLELQALVSRESTPTLYLEADSSADALPLWSPAVHLPEPVETVESVEAAGVDFEVADSAPPAEPAETESPLEPPLESAPEAEAEFEASPADGEGIRFDTATEFPVADVDGAAWSDAAPVADQEFEAEPEFEPPAVPEFEATVAAEAESAVAGEIEPAAASVPEPVAGFAEAEAGDAEAVEEAAGEAWEPIADDEPVATEEFSFPAPSAPSAPSTPQVAGVEGFEHAMAIEGDQEEPEPLPEFDYEPEPAIAAEPEDSVEVAIAAEPEPAAEPEGAAPAEGDDLLGTVRMVIPAEVATPAPEADDSAGADGITAPHPIDAAPPSSPEIDLASPAPAAAVESSLPAAEAIDPTEDATVLTAPRPSVLPPPPVEAPPAAPPAESREEDPMDRTSSRGGRSTQVTPPADHEGPGLAFVSGRVQRSLSDSPAHEEAKRLARLLISEIKLYNEEQVLDGRRNRDLYHRLREDIDRSRQIFDERVDSALRAEVDYFQLELVRSLAGGDPRALGI